MSRVLNYAPDKIRAGGSRKIDHRDEIDTNNNPFFIIFKQNV